MIDVSKMNGEWLRVNARALHGDPLLLEKASRALLLVQGLAESGLEFVFKGGTALMLLLPKPARFSIDADILLPGRLSAADAAPHVDSLITRGYFTRCEPHPRAQKGKLKKTHFKLYYPSVARRGVEDMIILDVLFEDGLYRAVKPVVLNAPFLPQTGKPVSVRLPDVDSLLGDKLSAFAPRTTGVPYEKNGMSMTLEIVKQLFDIGSLFPYAGSIPHISASFRNCAEKQIGYRGLRISTEDVLEDITRTALCLSTGGSLGKGDYNALKDGVVRTGSFIFSERFTMTGAVVRAAQAAYLAALIRGGKRAIRRFANAAETIDLEIKAPEVNRLNKLKKGNPEAFFYWYHAVEAEAPR
ncbi:MAG: nucleotidyl transferase AbiEii/AbiGii toxin family protein [Spirochaetales bacterium]|nr:nucleotidyl transferase AbiEii/AbiGii toxin family protein [Spirochaetales bacterium]